MMLLILSLSYSNADSDEGIWPEVLAQFFLVQCFPSLALRFQRDIQKRANPLVVFLQEFSDCILHYIQSNQNKEHANIKYQRIF